MKNCLYRSVFCLGLFNISSASAAVLAQYNFSTTTNSETGAGYNSAAPPSGVTATAVTDAGAGILASIELGTFASPALKLKPPGSATTTLAQSFSSNAYVTFTISAASGFDLTSISLQAARGGASLERGFALQSSVGGFGESAPVLFGATSVPSSQPNFTDYSTSLTGAGFQGLTSVDFRIYIFTPATGASVDFDNIVVNGNLIPEPSTAVFSSAALAAGLLRRSRKIKG